jgi:predicted transcriptional regulator of viral defense system
MSAMVGLNSSIIPLEFRLSLAIKRYSVYAVMSTRSAQMDARYTRHDALGISKDHREFLSRLHRENPTPFDIDGATMTLGLPRPKVRSLLRYWCARGWLSRIRRGIYITVPLNARNPADWREDAWITANTVFSPCYIGGWSAAEHWGLTEQIFSDIVVITSASVREKTPIIKRTKYVVVRIPDKKFFSLVSVWRNNVKIAVSSPSRTIADILNAPQLGGGGKHVAEITSEYFSGEHRNDAELCSCLEKLRNRTAMKRLGYLIETLSIGADETLTFCLDNVSAGYSRLDPTAPPRGKLVRRWMLQINVNIETIE